MAPSILFLFQKNKLAIKMVMLVVEIDLNLDLMRDKLDANHLLKYLKFGFKTGMVFLIRRIFDIMSELHKNKNWGLTLVDVSDGDFRLKTFIQMRHYF